MSITISTKLERELSDFGLVAALVSLGFEIRRTYKQGSRMFFIFTQNDELETAIEQYRLGALRVEPRLYFEATKRLKSLIYGE